MFAPLVRSAGPRRPRLRPAATSRRTTALVTGASSGIGLAFAESLAAEGHDLVVVARDLGRLERVALRLGTEHDVHIEVLVADLTCPEQRDRVVRRLAEPGDEASVDMLINNAGNGLDDELVHLDPGQLRATLDLDARAVLLLTRAALPGMLERGDGAIVNVSSVSGFLPRPGGAALYSAAKAYVTALTESLALATAGSGVRVMALCPGSTRTEFRRRMGAGEATVPALLQWDPGEVVAAALADLGRGRVLSVPGKADRAMAVVAALAPDILLRAVVARRRSCGARRHRGGLPRGAALITGATSDLGRVFAERLAADGRDLVLVARDTERVHALADSLAAAHGIHTEVLVVDLAVSEQRAVVERRLSETAGGTVPVVVLVNTGGDVTTGRSVVADPAVLDADFEENVVSVLLLTRAALPGMLARGQGAVLNVFGVEGSRTGWGPADSAAAAFVTILSRGIALTAVGRGVRVMALCPGVPGAAARRRPDQRDPGPRGRWPTPDVVVDGALADLRRSRTVSAVAAPAAGLIAVARTAVRALVRRLVSSAAR